MRLEPMRRLVQVRQIGHAVQVDARGTQVAVMSEEVEHREPARGSAHRHHGAGVGPAVRRSRAHAGRSVRRVDVTPTAGHRLRVGTSVSRRSAVIRVQHSPAPLEEVREPVVPRHRRLTGRSAVDPHEQWRRVGAGRGGRGRADQTTVDGGAVVGLPRDRFGLGKVERFEATDRAACHDVTLVSGKLVHHDLRRCAALPIGRPRCDVLAMTGRRARLCRAVARRPWPRRRSKRIRTPLRCA